MKRVHPWLDLIVKGVRAKGKEPMLTLNDYYRSVRPEGYTEKAWQNKCNKMIGRTLAAEWARLQDGTLAKAQEAAQTELAEKVKAVMDAGSEAVDLARGAFQKTLNAKGKPSEPIATPLNATEAAAVLRAGSSSVLDAVRVLTGDDPLREPSAVRGRIKFNDEPARRGTKPSKPGKE
jgi:hypothetical protein